MKGKQNRKHRAESLMAMSGRPSQRSASYDRPPKKSVLNSIIYQSSRNSLCSPREPKNISKLDNYVSYVAGGKMVQEISYRNSVAVSRPKTATPTPRRMSACIMEQGRKSVAKEATSRDFSKQSGCKTPREKSKPLFVKGNNIVKTSKSKQEMKKRKDPPQNKRISHKPDANKKQLKIDDKICEKQKKLTQKLFAGIQFHRELGRGAHALVKCGVDFNKQRKIAVKIYNKEELSSQDLKSIERQVQILGSLDHPNIIKLYQIIQTIKTINLVMEYGGGNSLEQYIRNKPSGRLQEEQAKKIFRELVEAVNYLHLKQIAHRDIKTENILLNKYLQTKIIDFGFSYKKVGQQFSHIFCGTPTYMSPEIITKQSHCPLLADRWSLGILLYTILHGHCPFKAQNQKELFQKILEHQIQFQEHVAVEAQELILRLLSKKPGDRPSPEQILQSQWLNSS